MSSASLVTARRGTRLLAYSHVTVDFSQGAIAALVPFLVMERGYSYAAGAGIVLAFSLVSSIVQPVFGLLGDRWQIRWLIPVSVLLAGLGIAAVGVFDSFWITALVAAVSGIGVAACHPAGASRAREISGGEHVMMSWFSLGGNIGFALAPLAVAASVGVLGLKASPLLVIPALTGIIAVAFIGGVHAPNPSTPAPARAAAGRDDWPAFTRLSIAIICRSIVFVGMGSFIVLFMHQNRGVSDALASASLFVFYLGGAVGTAIGGHLARRWQRTTILRWSYLAAVPVVAGMLLIPGPLAWVFIALASITLYVPFSLHVTLGQEYLPRHMGTAGGVTLGLAVSIGGLASPAIGALADTIGLGYALLPLIALPAIASLILLGMKDPQAPVAHRRRDPAALRLPPLDSAFTGVDAPETCH